MVRGYEKAVGENKVNVIQAQEICNNCSVCDGIQSPVCSNGECLISHTFLETVGKFKEAIESLEYYQRRDWGGVAGKALESYRREILGQLL